MKMPTLIVMCGLPGSGKSTYTKHYIEKYPNTVALSSDSIRAELYGREEVQGNPGEVFGLMHKRTLDYLSAGKNVIYDATNLSRKDRGGIVASCPKYVRLECHIIWVPIEQAILQDAGRSRRVGREVIDRMVKRFQAPYYDEGFDEIKVILPQGFDSQTYTNQCLEEMILPQDNPHHRMNVREHCESAYQHVKELGANEEVVLATRFHDVGKPYTKVFTDSQGRPSDIAHFYQHQCVGAWMSYGLVGATTYMAWLICYHMDIFLNTKYYKGLPEFLKKDLDLLHAGDMHAH